MNKMITKQIEALISPELITRKPFNLFIQKLYIKKSSQN